MLFYSNANASCSYTRIANLKKMASNVNITYTYEVVDNKAIFEITVANLLDGIYFYDSFNDKKYTQKGEITIPNFEGGKKYRFFIKSDDRECKDEVLLTKYLTLPKYNEFYGDPLCEGIENYALCQKWGTFSASTYKEYKSQIEKYKASIKKEEKEEILEEKTTFTDRVIKFIRNYYIFIFGGIIIVGLSLIYYLSRKNRFNF